MTAPNDAKSKEPTKPATLQLAFCSPRKATPVLQQRSRIMHVPVIRVAVIPCSRCRPRNESRIFFATCTAV
eukprot:scaffold145_cov261-Pinguiococcus_pyrenoidosus.AAC.1